MAWPAFYTYNFCPNPSAEVSLAGYQPILNTEQISQVNIAWAGTYGVQVVTPGTVPGEGVAFPPGSVLANATGAASAYIWGETGSLTVQAVQNPGGLVLGSMQVQLDGQSWQRVVLNNLTMTLGDDVYLVAYTTTSQALSFVVDAVQYEPESPAHPYIDGNSMYGVWTGTPGSSASYRQYAFPVSMSGGLGLDGTIGVIGQHEIFGLPRFTGGMDMSGQHHTMVAFTEIINGVQRTVIPPAIDTGVPGLPWEIAGGGTISVSSVSPGSAFTDFGIWETGTDPDPAMTLILANNAGTLNGATSYTQLFGAFSAPAQQLDSSGLARWQSAAYMAAGFRIASQPAWAAGAPSGVNFTQVQIEKMTASTPSTYQFPRALVTVVKPTAMNYVTNPSMEVNLTGWTAIGASTTITQVSGGYLGSYSMQVSVQYAGYGVFIMVPDLILGDLYNASAYVNPVSSNISDITMSVGSVQASANMSYTPYGSGAYGSGPYGGVNSAATPMETGTWNYRPWAPFAAPESSVVLSFIPVAITGAVYPLVFNVDCVMVSAGEVLGDYGDGSTSGWQWEAGGTPGLTRSYYYARQNAAAQSITSVLSQHIPLGLNSYAPEYAVPFAQ